MIFSLSLYTNVFAAIGCSLDDPDRDVKKLFPESSGYRTTFVTLKEIGGDTIKNQIETMLGDKLDAIYENLDVPYAYYTVLKGKDPVAYIHGVNQKGKFGVLQLVVATDLTGKIIAFYYQKISSPESAKFRDSVFTTKFKDLSLVDFTEKAAKIPDPSVNSGEDFKATLRGIKKDLILLDIFLHVRIKQGGK
jgi:hypothetical protein